MLPYWILFSVYSLGSFSRTRYTHFSFLRSPGFALGVLLTVLVIGLRYNVGGDWEPYRFIYESSPYYSWNEIPTLGDPGYMLLNKLAYSLGFGIWFVNLACAVIFTWGLVRFAERQPNPWLVFAVATPYLIIVVAMGYTRQGVAIGVLMAAIATFQKGQILRFLIYIAVAATFHKTAVIVLPLIALSAVKHRFAVYATAAALAAVLFLYFLDVFLDTLIRNYIDTTMESEGALIRVVLNLVPAIVYLLYQRRFAFNEQERLIWRNFAMAALVLFAALYLVSSSTVVDRVALYVIPLQIFVLSRLPYAFSVGRRPNSLLIALVLIYSAGIQFIWLTFAEHADSWLPYRFFLLE